MALGHRESYTGLTREQKIQLLRSRQLDISTTAANAFSTDVPTRKRRHIVGIVMTNPDASPISVTLSKVLRDNTLEDFLDSYFIDAQGNESINKGSIVDLDNPILVLTGDQNFEFDVDTALKTGTATIWWYDNPP
jgi:hypothetical protein